MKNLLLFIYLILSSIGLVFSQSTTIFAVEYDTLTNLNFFVSINPENGNLTQIDTINGAQSYSINNAVLNTVNDHYLITGNDEKIYTIDVNVGSVLNVANLTADIIELQYDKINDKYYALEVESVSNSSGSGTSSSPTPSASKFYLVLVDHLTGTVSRIDSISGVTSVQLGSSMFNTNTNEYLFVANKDEIFTIDGNSGAIVTSSKLTTEISELQLDLKNNNIYALEVEASASGSNGSSTNSTNTINNEKIYLVGVNSTNGVVSRIDSIQGLNAFQVNSSNIDTVNNYFEVIDKDNKLLSLDISTAVIVSQPQLNANIINSTISAISAPTSRFDNSETTNPIKLYPNPAKNYINIETTELPTLVEIYNQRGVLVMRQTINNNNEELDVTKLNTGLYIFKMYNSKEQKSERILIQ